ncbi:Flp family type IVb pilin [Pseudaminobacter soli (ex Li et al. 2025)]|uniref:Flp family type IVb pilin n=1 Tax=Pseudaminobacter soli (ex Li et al. 2025) TaxID=1295366 RepID=A0A2P7S5B0_9HYPH|nr:Flp family type IVb pilin [Mesorhizobium soli]PSJ57647.1 Flp family type IVb pilin [Mesorhizobium soli]
MKQFMTMARQFRDDEDGAAMVEYSILLGIVAAASILSIIAIGKWTSDQFTTLCGTLDGKGAGASGTACKP